MLTAAAMLLALILDAAIGWPDRLYQRIGHPVSWLGTIISWLEERLNTGSHRARNGVITAVIAILTMTLPAILLSALLPGNLIGAILTGIIAAPLIAARSLRDHVEDVAKPLVAHDLPHAREAISRIVGRDPETLDEPAIARAGIESLAENTSDGVIAPIFWGVILGLPGIAAYKAINTLDSMIGYRNDRYMAFGRFAAQLDDIANLIPARLTGALMCLAAPKPRHAFQVMRRDAPAHRSPNAGWPEAAMAAALNCRLSGPRAYDQGIEDQPWLNADAPDPVPEDMFAALALFKRTGILAGIFLAALALI